MEILLNSPDNLQFLPYLFLYAEMHYRFKFTGSRYFKREPEILVDSPHLVKLKTHIPIMLLVKDADQYPIILEKIEIQLTTSSGQKTVKSVDFHQNISDHFWYQSVEIDRTDIFGQVTLNVHIDYQVNGKSKSCINHNLALLSSIPFQVYLPHEPLPGVDKIHWGDLHYHSNLTEDMVEFGAPLIPTLNAANALGLSFFCPTDHSYDLDDLPGSWTITDPLLKKWKNSRKDIQAINNSHRSCTIIPSEEVTVRNSSGRNVHALVFNNPTYIPGSGDGAEKRFKTRSEHSIDELSDLISKDALVIAAHPFTPTPFLQWLLIKRGIWNHLDYENQHVAGFQIMNGCLDSGFERGKEQWLELLKSGIQKFIYAGNDAHGNFNIFRQIKTPMMSLWEKNEQIFGKWKTGVFAEDNSIQAIVKALRRGNCIISNGPFIHFIIKDEFGITQTGETCSSSKFTIRIECESSVDYGGISFIKIFQGYRGEIETCLQNIAPDTQAYNYVFQQDISEELSCYFRVELETNCSGRFYFAMTNPIWINPVRVL